MDMRVLITGGTGFIGQYLTRAALRRGWEVSLFVRQPDGAPAQALAKEGATLVMGDVTDRRSMKAALEVTSPDVFFHNAGWYELGVPRSARRRMWMVNVEAVENALALAAEVGVPKVVYTSTTTALGDTGGEVVDESFTRQAQPTSHYEQTKADGHRVALRHQAMGEPVVIVCPAQVIGPGDHSPFGHLARLFVRGWLPPVAWAPEAAFTFAHVEDVAQAILLAGDTGQPGETYFVAGHVLSNRAMMRLWGQVTGRRSPFVWLPRPLAVVQAGLIAPLLRLLGLPAFLSPEVVRSTYVSFRYRSDKAVSELGVSFRSAEQAWRDTLSAESQRAHGQG
jgi:dihydroflavonol-4-reductase